MKILALLAAICFLVRSLPRLRLPNTYLSDTYFHLHCARLIRESGFKLPARLPGVLLQHEHTYPFLYHGLLALLPLRTRLWLERFTGAIFDTASLVITWFFADWLLSQPGGARNPEMPIYVAALFAVSPALLRIGSGPRAYNGSPRPLGQFLYLVHVLTAFYAFSTQSVAGLAVSLLAGALVVLAAKFSTQVLAFFGVFFGVFVSPWYFAVLGGVLGVALLLAGRRTWRVLVGQYRHSDFYVRHLQRIFVHPHTRSLRDYLREALAQLRTALVNKELKTATRWYFAEAHPLHLLLTVFTPILVLPFLIASVAELPSAERFLLVWVFASLICFAATKTKLLMFLGEGERYLEYALVPTLILAVDFLLDSQVALVWVFLAYSVLAAAFYVASYLRQFAPLEAAAADYARAFETLNQQPPGVIMPIGSLHWQTLYRAKAPVLTIGVNIDRTLLPLEEFMLVYGCYPYPSADFPSILTKYDVAYVLTDRQHLRHYVDAILHAPDIFFQRVSVLFESPSVMLFRVNGR